jgi:toxin-antitoxin system PIN domain toxin
MSFAIDVNVLLYASDQRSEFHVPAARFLKSCVLGSETFCLGWPTLMSYLRIATHPAVFAQPLAHAAAASNIAALLAAPHVRVLSEDEGFWDVYQEVTRRVPTRGNLVPDAHLAALLRQHGVRTLYTLDRDFRKFDFLSVRDPFEGMER